MLSRHPIRVSHSGHRDGGDESDSLRGKRQITTFAKLPKSSPNAPIIAAIYTSAIPNP